MRGFHTKIIIALIIAFTLFSKAPLHAKGNSGKKYFEQAYRVEKSSPDTAIRLYRTALERGLDRKLTSAARWRLFYLLKGEKRYGEALILLPRLGGKLGRVSSDLHRDIKEYWKINDSALQNYVRGIQAMNGANLEKSHTDYFVQALRQSGGNRKFRMEIIERLVSGGRSSDVLSVLDHSGGQSSIEDRIFQADLMIRFNRLDEAEELLRKEIYASPGSLAREHKYRVLYLLGKVHRKNKDHERSILYFRLAAKYADTREANRQISLAAYSLYRRGYRSQANGLVRSLPSPQDPDVFLVKHVLGVEAENREDSYQALRKKRDWLKKRAENGASFLEQKALEILEDRP